MKPFRRTRQAVDNVSEAAVATTKTLVLVSTVAVVALLVASVALMKASR